MSDQPPLTITVELTSDDLYKFTVTALLRRFRWLLVIPALVIILSLASLLFGNATWELSFQTVFPLLLLIVLPYSLFVAPHFSSRNYLKKNPNLAGPFTYIFSASGIELSTPTSQSHLDWNGIIEARETSAQFLLFPQTAIAHLIPKRCLKDPADQDRLREFARNYVKKVKLKS